MGVANGPATMARSILPFGSDGTTFVQVYDVSNKANPVLTRNFTMTGNYQDSRLIGNYIYDIVSQSAYLVNDTPVLPAIFNGSNAYGIEPTQVYYANTSTSYYTFTTIASLDIMNDAATPTTKTIMMGNTGNIYVSLSNIYVTYPIFDYQTVPLTTPNPASSAASASTGEGNGTSSVTVAPAPIAMPAYIISPSWEGTAIYRIQIAGASLNFVAQGNVTGSVLSQYSMDENNGYFRIATTSTDYNSNTGQSTQQNNLYVLDMNLNIVGKLENLASGENLYAARFMGNRCYLVTFNQIDPLFVVDLTQPTNPTVLGNLTLPGYSSFLQPYDATHLIGIGQDVNASIDANLVETPGDVYYTAILGLKVSLFDVSDVANPKEISSVVIGDRGTTSDALSDPHAILFDASRNLLVLPVDLYLMPNVTSTPTPTPSITSGAASSGTTIAPILPPISVNEPVEVWQGAYIFSVDLTNGIVIRGNVTQLDNVAAYLANPSLALNSNYPWTESNYFITRELYIGNVLYTISDGKVQLNSLDTLALLAKLN